MNIYNKIVEVFYPEIVLDANSSVRGNISSDDNLFKLNIKSPRVEAYKTVIEELNVQIDNKNPLFNTQLSIDNVTSKYYNISKLQLVNITLNDTLYFRTEFDGGIDKTEKYNLAFYFKCSLNVASYRRWLDIKKSVSLKDVKRSLNMRTKIDKNRTFFTKASNILTEV